MLNGPLHNSFIFQTILKFSIPMALCMFTEIDFPIAVNNAGTINKNNKLWQVPAEEFDMVIDTNVKGIANIMRHFLPLMIEKKHGIIVNISSGWGRSAAAEVTGLSMQLFPWLILNYLFK